MSNKPFAGKHVVIMGLGLHGGGVGAAEYFAKQGARVLVTDLKSAEQLAPSLKKLRRYRKIDYVLGEHREADFTKADLIIKNPDVPASSPYLVHAQKAGVRISSDVGIFFENCPAPILGITGSKGKTTTASLAAHLLRAQYRHVVLAGNVRLSVLSVLDSITPESAVVLELSSFQLEVLPDLQRSPHVAVITELFPDHLNRYADLYAYYEAKEHIFRFQKEDDFRVVNFDNATVRDRALHLGKGQMYGFSGTSAVAQGTFFRDEKFVWSTNNEEYVIAAHADLQMKGAHNIRNACAAITAAILYGLVPKEVAPALQTFKGVPYRQEPVGEVDGVHFVNDTASTTPQSTIVALDAMTQPTIVIAGGSEKGLDYTELAAALVHKAKSVILLHDEASFRLASLINANDPAYPVLWAYTMDEAVEIALQQAQPGDVVLLSPAAASFGLFANEFDRGDQFTEAVQSREKKLGKRRA